MAGRPPKEIVNPTNRIREARGSLSLTSLSKRAGISYQRLQRYETGERPITLYDLERIAAALEVPAARLLTEYRPPDEQECAMLEVFRQISPADRDRLIRMAKGLLPSTGRASA